MTQPKKTAADVTEVEGEQEVKRMVGNGDEIVWGICRLFASFNDTFIVSPPPRTRTRARTRHCPCPRPPARAAAAAAAAAAARPPHPSWLLRPS